jgi:hypothetical protein
MAVLAAARWAARTARGEVVRAVGGPARARLIALLGAVLALNGADAVTVRAIAPQLEHALHTGNTGIGLLSSVALMVGGRSSFRWGARRPLQADPDAVAQHRAVEHRSLWGRSRTAMSSCS